MTAPRVLQSSVTKYHFPAGTAHFCRSYRNSLSGLFLNNQSLGMKLKTLISYVGSQRLKVAEGVFLQKSDSGLKWYREFLQRLKKTFFVLSYNLNKTRLRSKVFSLEKTLVLTWFYKGSILFCFLGGGKEERSRWAKLNQTFSLNYWTYVKSLCQILTSY